MRYAICALILTLLNPAISVSADEAKESVEADASTRQVAITSSFTGTEILVFGTVENSVQPSAEAGTYDVVVVVEGAPGSRHCAQEIAGRRALDQYVCDAIYVVAELLC